MEVKEAWLKRRSVRKFTEEPVTEEQINELIHAAMSGPSACNKRPWEFYVVTNPEMLKAFQSASRFTKISAPLAIVVCGNLKRALPLNMADFWIQDCSAATENILLRATDLGLGAVWCGMYPQRKPEKRVRELLGIDDKRIALNIIYIGHPAQEPEPKDWYEEACVYRVK